MGHFQSIINNYKDNVNLSNEKAWGVINSMQPLFDDLEHTNKEYYWKIMRDIHVEMKGKHFDECFAMYQVSAMHHTKLDGKVCYSEMFSLKESEEVYERYRRSINANVTKWDIYVALNAQYHDYDNLYSQWFNNDKEKVKDKIIESTIVFWFKDDDAEDGKLWDYFSN